MAKLDWQHIAIFALFIAASAVIGLLPRAAPYVAPLIPVLGAMALGKQWVQP